MFMLNALRFRLLLSYLVVLLVTLGVMGAALVFILNTRDAPPEPTYQNLAAMALSLNPRDIMRDVDAILPARRLERITEALADAADARSVRILLVAPDEKIFFWDSAGTFLQADAFDGHLDAYAFPARSSRGGDLTRIDGVVGDFKDRDGDWLFVGFEALPVNGRSYALLFAAPRPVQTLQAALDDFGTSLLPILLQAAAFGLAIAIAAALLISRSIARPLQTAAQAAADIAQGHYDRRVPVTGPQEVRDVALAFNQMSERVQTEQQVQRDLLSNVSHDLKTPLTSIQGWSQAIMDGVAPDPAAVARIIHEEAGRINRLVNELTDLTRLQAGRMSMNLVPIDVGSLTGAVAARLIIVAREQGVTLRVHAPPLPEVTGDGDRLAQVITNLVSNAIKYTPNGGQVEVTARVNGGGVEVMVSDTGVGIPADELPRIFERFYQVDKARGPHRGTGLGLAITREIVQAHGGKITASSAGVGRGSTFSVWLPSPGLSTIVRRR